MEEHEKNIQFHYDWKYEALRNLLKFAKWAIILLTILYALYLLLKYAPIWLLCMIVGSVIFAIPNYLFIKSFFKVDYLIFLYIDLENRLITPYFVPKKLILEGEWELIGVKTRYRSENDIIDDAEINRIYCECEKIDKKINNLEEKKTYLEALRLLTFKNLPYKKTYKRWKLYNLFGFNILARYPILEKFPILIRRKEQYKRYEEIRRELLVIKQKIKDLKAEKNSLLMGLEWTGMEGGEIYFINEIDRKAKKIYLSPLHQCSDLELQLNKNKFKELRLKLSEMIKEYAVLKINYEDEILLKAVDLIEEIGKEDGDKNEERESGEAV